jgi:hypothetical protein
MFSEGDAAIPALYGRNATKQLDSQFQKFFVFNTK